MRLLVAGGAGFIGSTYVRRRLRENPGDEVVVLDKLTYAGRKENLAAADQERLRFVEADIADGPAMQQAFAGRSDRVLMKLIVSKETRKVLCCHIVAPGAGEMIQLAGIAVKMGATKEDFDRTVAVHPTMSEEIVTMREPARTG